MKCLTKVLIGMMALSTYAESKLVIYGPQELIDNFNERDAKTAKTDEKSTVTKKSKSISIACLSSWLTKVFLFQ